MCSTRNHTHGSFRRLVTLACAALASGIVGCQQTVPPMTTQLNKEPLVIDEAVQKRDWDRTPCYYANGTTISGGNGYMFQTHETISDPYRRLADVPVTVGNILLLPIGVFANSAFEPQEQRGAVFPPTYTAQPPLTPPGAME